MNAGSCIARDLRSKNLEAIFSPSQSKVGKKGRSDRSTEGGSLNPEQIDPSVVVDIGNSKPEKPVVCYGPPPSKPKFLSADLDNNGIVDGQDLGLMLGDWGTKSKADLDQNGIVDELDLKILNASWGKVQ